MNPRYIISNVLQHSGVNAAVLGLRRDSLAVLCYHRVLGCDDPRRGSVDPALVTSTHIFERQMEVINRRFKPVRLSDVLGWLEGQSNLPKRAVLITLDDGVADTYLNAFPVMKRLFIPGLVFLATGFIGSRLRQWADVVHEQVAARSDRATAVRVVERLKNMPSARRQELLESMSDGSDEPGTDDAPNLTWEQVEEMANHGFAFGSHTRSHVILPYETDDGIRAELVGAAGDIRLRLGHSPAAFAYPDGQFDDRTAGLVADSGCQAAFTCEEGFVSRRSPRHALPRLLMHDGVSADAAGNFSSAMFLTYLSGTIPRRYRRVGK